MLRYGERMGKFKDEAREKPRLNQMKLLEPQVQFSSIYISLELQLVRRRWNLDGSSTSGTAESNGSCWIAVETPHRNFVSLSSENIK